LGLGWQAPRSISTFSTHNVNFYTPMSSSHWVSYIYLLHTHIILFLTPMSHFTHPTCLLQACPHAIIPHFHIIICLGLFVVLLLHPHIQYRHLPLITHYTTHCSLFFLNKFNKIKIKNNFFFHFILFVRSSTSCDTHFQKNIKKSFVSLLVIVRPLTSCDTYFQVTQK